MKKKKVLILGASGMLGSALYDVLKDEYDLVLSFRDQKKIALLEEAFGGVDNHRTVSFDAEQLFQEYYEKKGYPSRYLKDFFDEVGDIDYVINAIGVTIPFSLENPTLTFFINSALPHILATELGEKLIHVTTDCAFNGKEGFPYDEESPKTPVDIYGLSKSIGEPTNCLTLRTSIFGKELEGFTGFLDWFLQQKSQEISGFDEHYWNGVTTKQFAQICHEIMSEPEKYPKKGIFHVFSDVVSKYEMLHHLKDKYCVDCVIHKDSENSLNRTLSSSRDLHKKLTIKPFKKMVDDM